MPDGKVLVTGGFSANDVLASAEIFDPKTELWTPTESTRSDACTGDIALAGD